MIRTRIHNTLIAGVLAFAVALTGVAGAAFAQETAAPQQPAATGIAPTTPANPWSGGAQRTPLVTKIADILGMKVEDLVAARQQGKSFVDIAKERGVSEAQLLETLMAQAKAYVDSLVASGRMTQAQAEQVLTNVRTKLQAAITRTAVGPQGAGLRIGRGPGAGRRGGAGVGAGFGAGYRRGWERGFRRGFKAGMGLGQGPADCPFRQQTQTQTQTQTQN
ncbi:MAG: hypothetical protein ACM309_10645 [Bacillota bacterium]